MRETRKCLTGGKRRRAPAASVINPGIRSRKPAIIKKLLLIMESAGSVSSYCLFLLTTSIIFGKKFFFRRNAPVRVVARRQKSIFGTPM
ncbi:MAG: hypothetical protein PSN37_03070 [Alphaproteobacteria bacterium]|nr:hypothetical protein [Alphaproteobacteria bacterium]